MSANWLMGCLGFAVLLAGWVLVCNQRTYRQRNRLLDLRPGGEQFWAFDREYDRVSYDRHLWQLVSLRDPRKLYGPLHQGIWK